MEIKKELLQTVKEILNLKSENFKGYIHRTNNKITSVSIINGDSHSDIIRCIIPKEFTKLRAINIFTELRDMCNAILLEIDK